MTIEKMQEVLNLGKDMMTEDEFFEVKEKLDRITKTISANDLVVAIGDATSSMTDNETLSFLLYMHVFSSMINSIFPDEAEEIMRIFDEEGGSEQ